MNRLSPPAASQHRQSTPLPTYTSSLESLESRLAPAGIVTLTLVNGALTVTGDASANDFQITENGNQWTIESQAGGTTQFKIGNGPLQSAITFAAPLSMKANLGSGDDSMLLNDLFLPGALTVDMLDGNDTVDFTSTDFGGLATVRMGVGNDYFTAGGSLLFNKGLSVDMGTGSNTFEINATTLQVNGNLTALAGGSVVDTQNFYLAASTGVVTGAALLRTTTGSATNFEVGLLAADDLWVKGALTLQALAGNDNVILAGNIEVGTTLGINLGNGNNAVSSPDMAALLLRTFSYTGGTGDDTVVLNGTVVDTLGNLGFTGGQNLMIGERHAPTGGAGTNKLDLNPATSLRVGGALTYLGGIGKDTLWVDGPTATVVGAISMAASSGTNAFSLMAVTGNVGAVSFSAAAGVDTVDVGEYNGASSLITVRGGVTVNTGAGEADVMVRDADIYGNLNVTTNSYLGGVDTVQILDSDVRGTTFINLVGAAWSDVVVRDGIFDRAVTINTGAGDDYVLLDTDTAVSSIYSWFGGPVRVNLGAGNDVFGAGASPQVATVGNDFNSYVDVNGGTGDDKAYFIHPGYNNGFNGPLPWTYSVEEVH